MGIVVTVTLFLSHCSPICHSLFCKYMSCVLERNKQIERNYKLRRDSITNSGRNVTLAVRQNNIFQLIQCSIKTKCIYCYKFHLNRLN